MANTPHAALTGAELHEPKGADTAAADKVYISNGAGSGAWSAATYALMPSGSIVTFANAVTNSSVTSSTLIPFDNTIPQNTEGAEVLTCVITPKASGNKLRIRAIIPFSTSNAGGDYMVGLALFKDSDASAIAATNAVTNSSAGRGGCAVLEHVYTTTGTSAITFRVRIGCENTPSVFVNGQVGSSTRVFGGVSSATITIEEIKA